MKQFIYTVLFLTFTLSASAQELFFKPDTIFYYTSPAYRVDAELSAKYEYLYTDFGKIDSIKNYSYDKGTKTYTLTQAEDYIYDSMNRLIEVKQNPTFRFKYFYNKEGLDSLFIWEYLNNQTWQVTRSREKKYNANNAIISELSKRGNNGILVKDYERYVDYDVDGNMIQDFRNLFNNNLQATIKSRYRYTYTYEGGRIKSEIYDAKTFNTSDTTWTNQYKHDYIYVDGDNKVDKKINSVYNPAISAYVTIDTFRYTYTPNLWVEEKSTIRFTKQFDDNGNEIFYSVERKRSNGVWTKENQNNLVYENNQIIAKEYYYVDPNDTNQEMYLIQKESYGYRKLSGAEDIKFNNKLNVIIYPNPSQNVAIIDGGDANIQKMTLYNMHGQIMKVYEKPSAVTQIERDGLKFGTYYLLIQSDQGSITKPIIFTE